MVLPTICQILYVDAACNIPREAFEQCDIHYQDGEEN